MERNNAPLFAEEIIIEEQTVGELKEKIKNLQEELVEQKRHADKMEELAWEMWEEKKGLQTRFKNFKSKLLGSLFKNKKKSKEISDLEKRMSRLRVNKDQQMVNLNEELRKEKEDKGKKINEINDLKEEKVKKFGLEKENKQLKEKLTSLEGQVSSLQNENSSLRSKSIDNYPKTILNKNVEVEILENSHGLGNYRYIHFSLPDLLLQNKYEPSGSCLFNVRGHFHECVDLGYKGSVNKWNDK